MYISPLLTIGNCKNKESNLKGLAIPWLPMPINHHLSTSLKIFQHLQLTVSKSFAFKRVSNYSPLPQFLTCEQCIALQWGVNVNGIRYKGLSARAGLLTMKSSQVLRDYFQLCHKSEIHERIERSS
ncbi:hypothetical protein NPIL_108081 [Nephila pilipes]|uniref:Uncharacterized protein n=1 Tax=Nephila pilipes TaxID=299642 RepID=A0A8X6MXF9_NEPPI|nr:hypothetical protein NPIL_108081 [Nephila pilipes]